MSKSISINEVKQHSKPESLWIIVDSGVYDLTEFQEEHPGGKKILARVGGKDASKQFWKYHNEGAAVPSESRVPALLKLIYNKGILKKYSDKLKVGELKEEAKL